MQTLDLKKDLKYLYQPSAKKIEVVDVPAMNFVMIDGAIQPGEKPGTSPLFQENMGVLYSAAYTLKFAAKQRKQEPFDYPLMASEGLWWVEDGLFDITQPGNWKYTLMIVQPDLVTPEMFAEALAQLRKKKGDQPAFARLRLERFHEGLCVQTLHVGPYAPNQPPSNGCALSWPGTACATWLARRSARAANIMKSTWATRCAPTRRN